MGKTSQVRLQHLIILKPMQILLMDHQLRPPSQMGQLQHNLLSLGMDHLLPRARSLAMGHPLPKPPKQVMDCLLLKLPFQVMDLLLPKLPNQVMEHLLPKLPNRAMEQLLPKLPNQGTGHLHHKLPNQGTEHHLHNLPNQLLLLVAMVDIRVIPEHHPFNQPIAPQVIHKWGTGSNKTTRQLTHTMDKAGIKRAIIRVLILQYPHKGHLKPRVKQLMGCHRHQVMEPMVETQQLGQVVLLPLRRKVRNPKADLACD